MKKDKIKYLHIAIIIIGIIYIFLPAFHTNLWFDESYSVALAKHSFVDIWTIGSHDVHPILYYWMLHILFLIFGNSILAYRLFSVIAIVILIIMGYTHIRKEFGEKTGLIFSFLVSFLPVITVYASEIRMYSWTMLFVTIMFIYAYRIYKGDCSNKNWIIFAVFSLASAYMHYYGLMTAGVINLLLFIYIIVDTIKKRKKDNTYKIINNNIIKFAISAIVQIVLYIPWLIFFIKQYNQVSKGFWIPKSSLEVYREIFEFQFTGNLLETFHINHDIALVFAIIITVYLIYQIYKSIKNKENIFPGIVALSIYLCIILIARIVSIKTPVLYARYMFTSTGIFILFMSFFMSKEKNKYLNLFICAIIIFVSTYITVNLMKENYDKGNKGPLKLIQNNIKENDILLYGNMGSGFVISAFYPENIQYFYDEAKWNVEEAYKAYGPNMKTIYSLEEIEDYKGRIWIIGADNYAILEQFSEDEINVLIKEKFSTRYKGYQYTVTLIEKNS